MSEQPQQDNAAPAVNGDHNGDNKEKEVTENGTTGENAEPVAENENEPPKKEMRAVVLTGFGGLKSVKILKKPEPSVAEGEVLIRVKAW